VQDDAEVLGSGEELMHCRAIVREGTSADAQLAVFEAAQGRSDNRGEALRAVTDWIAEATLQWRTTDGRRRTDDDRSSHASVFPVSCVD
jgi:hypothetical protein